MDNVARESSTAERNPPSLPSGYEIRRLSSEHIPWAKAIMIHSNLFHSPVWSLLYLEDLGERAYQSIAAVDHLVEHQVASGMSFGIFDTQYQFKWPDQSTATEGKLYWDAEKYPNADGPTLLKQMDFPLVSIALAYDQHTPLDKAGLEPMMKILPLFGRLDYLFNTLDRRDLESWKAKGPREVLMRNATSTRHDYEGKQLMKTLAQFLMGEAKLKGYRGINIECVHDAVSHVWSNPPKPFKAEIICQVDMATYEEEEDGKRATVFAPSKQLCTRIYVTLVRVPRHSQALQRWLNTTALYPFLAYHLINIATILLPSQLVTTNKESLDAFFDVRNRARNKLASNTAGFGLSLGAIASAISVSTSTTTVAAATVAPEALAASGLAGFTGNLVFSSSALVCNPWVVIPATVMALKCLVKGHEQWKQKKKAVQMIKHQTAIKAKVNRAWNLAYDSRVFLEYVHFVTAIGNEEIPINDATLETWTAFILRVREVLGPQVMEQTLGPFTLVEFMDYRREELQRMVEDMNGFEQDMHTVAAGT